MKLNYKRIAVRLTLALLLFCIAAAVIIDRSEITQKWLKHTATVESDLIIIEGWIPPNYFESIYNECSKRPDQQILITGVPSEKSISLKYGGRIVFKNLTSITSNKKKDITLTIEGTYAKNEFSKCHILKNDSLISTGEYKGDSTISFQTCILPSDSLIIHFYNDFYHNGDDRNITVSSLIIDKEDINLHSKNTWLSTYFYRINTDFGSNAEWVGKNLAFQGISEDRIHHTASSKYGISKTYSLASQAVNWMKDNEHTSANIITLAYHSRRTLSSFKKASKKMNFGVISLNAYTSKKRVVKEIIGNVSLRLTPRFIAEIQMREYKTSNTSDADN